jgi:predicted nucleic acid-binding protein
MTFIESVLGDHDLAQKVGEALLSSPFTIMLRVDDEAFDEAWGRFKSERGLSFTDCSSFVLMERYGVGNAFTFDGHFKGAGFRTLPWT